MVWRVEGPGGAGRAEGNAVMNEHIRPSRGRVRHAAWLILGFAATLVAGDVVLSRARLPRVEGSTNELLWKWELFAEARPTPDVVILGSSYELFGVAPAAVERGAAAAGSPVRVVNLAATASSLVSEYLLARRMVEGGRLPRIVYVGITPKAIEDDRYTWHRGGVRAFAEARDLPLASRTGGRTLTETLSAAAFRSYHQWHDARLIAERLMIGAPLRPAGRLREHADGWAEWAGPRMTAAAPGASDVAGPVEPVPPAGGAPGQPGGGGATSCDANALAARRLVALLRESGVEVRFIELPHGSRSPAAENPAANRDYQAFRDALESETGAPVLRPPAGLLTDADYFDDAHLTAAGAQRLSVWLGADVARCVELAESGGSADRAAVAAAGR